MAGRAVRGWKYFIASSHPEDDIGGVRDHSQDLYYLYNLFGLSYAGLPSNHV